MSGKRGEVYLPPLSKEDLKNLAKKQQKAKRDEEAKTAKTRPQNYNAPMGSSVSFDAPVKVRTRDADVDNRKLMDILGPYDRMSHVIMSGKTRDLMGVEQQPATPLPSKKAGAAFFDRNKLQGKNPSKEIPSTKPKDSSTLVKPSVPIKQRTSTSEMKPQGTKENPSKQKETVNVDIKNCQLQSSQIASTDNSAPSTSTEKPIRSDQRDGNSSNKKLSNSQNSSKSEFTNQNSKKDIAGNSGKHANEVRVPVLDSLNQEFIGQSKRDPSQSVSSASKISPNQQFSMKSVERTSKKTHSEPSTVLKESKEENKKAPNGKFHKNTPRLHIPEKNVEDMLKELMHIPQPLTGIQTPFKDSKFPFQEKLAEPVNVRDANLQSRSHISAPVKVESKQNRVVEEIQEKDDSDSSDSGEEVGDDDDDDGSSGSGSGSDDNDVVHDVEDDVEEGEVKSDKEQDNTEGKDEPPQDKIPVPVSANSTIATKGPPVKEQGPMSSSDSSSSGSESSDSGSDSESDMSDIEKHDILSPETEKMTPTKLKTSPEYMDTTPSPSRQSWNLGAFLPCRSEAPGPLSSSTKPISIEAPASDKSDPDHFDDFVKRSADHVSDENPQSVDQESIVKPMSADEFSPPAPSLIDKQMLSPIKSPQSVKSPTKRTSSSATEKAQSDSASVKTKCEMSVPYDRYDSIKHRERKKSTSISSPDPVVKEPIKQKLPQGRNKSNKRVFTPPVVPSDTSSSDSDIEIDVSSNPPLKAIPKSPRKPVINSVSTEIYKPSKNKESKREKLLKEQNSVKLKKGDVLHSKQSYCDISEAMSNVSSYPDDLEADSMKNIFKSFTGVKPLSPIPSDPKFECVENIKNIKSDILPVKNLFNGSVKYLNGKPSVLVQIELNLFNKMMVKDKTDPNFLRIKPEVAKRLKDNSLLGIGSIKSSKVTSAKSAGTIIANKSLKVLESNSEVTTNSSSVSNHSANNSQPSANISSSVSANCENERTVSEIVSKPKVSHQKVVSDNSNRGYNEMPDFDSLPVKEAVEKVLSEDTSSESSSSDSDIEIDSKLSKNDPVSSHPKSFNKSPPDKKKRKMDSHRADDSKRRKTLPSKVLPSQSTPDRPSQKSSHHFCDPSPDEVTSEHNSSSRKSTGKRERNNSSSSQQSTLSHTSTKSNHSKPSSRNSHSHKSQKKVKLGDPQLDLNSSHPTESTQSQIRSSPTALSTSLPSIKHEKPNINESVRVNGHIPQQLSIVPRPDSDHRARTKSHRPVSSNQDVEVEDGRLSGSEYHKKATMYKHKADAMPTVPHSLDKYIVFLESVLYFLLSGVARERDHQNMEASSLFKDTHRLMAHHYHQFRLNSESDSSNKSDVIFTVLCLRIQSLVYLKLYKLKRAENMKLKRILDDHHSKSVKPTSQPKPPSAPSPHQTTWNNRSTGTPSPMSPSPSPANSVCSVGSVGSDQTPSKLTNGTSNSAPIAPPGSVLVPQRIHSITQKYFTTTSYLIQAHEFWDQAENSISGEVKDFITQLDNECGQLTINSSLLFLVEYCRRGLAHLKER